MTTYDTLSEAIKAKQSEGYLFDFNLKPPFLECEKLAKSFSINDFFVNAFYRFEGESNPDDSSVLYAIQTTCGTKGLLVDAYGMYSESISPEMVEKLKIR